MSLKQGKTNKTYIIDNTFVVEKNKNEFNHKINYKILDLFDFVPKVKNNTVEKLESEVIDGEHLSNPSNIDLITLAKNIRQVHTSDLKFPSTNLRKRVQKYIKILNDKGIKLDEVNLHYRSMQKLLTRMNNINPVHNDLWIENVLKDSSGKIWIVDWEYATMGDKHFDLAYFIMSANLDEMQEEIFLESYNDTEDFQAFIPEWMPMYKLFVVWLTVIWAYAQNEMPFDVSKMLEYLRNH